MSKTKILNVGEIETQKQKYIIEKLRKEFENKYKETNKKKTFHVETFGCQMNFRDSEKITGILTQIGYEEVDTEEADFVIYNTCTVRENANNKVYGRLGYLGKLKKENPDMIIAICGCMMQVPEVVEKIKKSYRFVDIIFGTHNIYKLAELIELRLYSKRMVIDLLTDAQMIVENLPSERKYDFKAGVNIMFGCNNFCTYCIVPYVRGRERSRSPEEIISEIKQLANDGVVEIMLLGQNVNSYGKNLDQPMTFASLLQRVERVEGIERIRFMTSNPMDLSDDLIEVMKNSSKICNHLHLPIQSGSTRLLKLMNRKYTKESYLELVRKLKIAIPNISLTTDIIVGFPGETDEDFEDTIDVVKQVGFDSAFTFIYSKRTGTPAATMDKQVPNEVCNIRFDHLLKTIRESSKDSDGGEINSIQKVLVEGINEQNPELLTGRLTNNMLVHFKGENHLIGKIIPVKLIEKKRFYYMGEIPNQ
ncbi:MAG TPA: tRNA (N6-isopentenyl adenosine(37)-C2)-methylthiotransferase MiaB [Clostridiales bacterium]|nr:tRNA (N6-isopentenyl adenosine(37)-C2)-methylthiotransferase MiaB [Clostridiales bacterium]